MGEEKGRPESVRSDEGTLGRKTSDLRGVGVSPRLVYSVSLLSRRVGGGCVPSRRTVEDESNNPHTLLPLHQEIRESQSVWYPSTGLLLPPCICGESYRV